MSKEYRFCYHGTKEMLFHQCNQCRYVNEYIISTLGGKIEFGIERAGHSGGYWYTPNIIEYEDKIELVGTIQYIGPENSTTRTKTQKILDKIGLFLLSILLFPVLAIFFVISKIQWIIRKIRKQPNPKTTEDKLFDLMETRLNCQRVIDENDS